MSRASKRQITIIFPEYGDFTPVLDDKVLRYPETETVPQEQINKVRRWLNHVGKDADITVISVSPYVIECVIKAVENEDCTITYSNGKTTSYDVNFIFKPMADAMSKLFF